MGWSCTPWQQARSFLFVPADRPDRLDKACASGADALIFDLEDAVAAPSKAEARRHLPALVAGARRAGLAALVRLNHDVLMLGDDLQALVQAQADGWVWPKAEASGMWEAVDAALHSLQAPADLKAVALVEHPRMMDPARLMALAQAPRVQALALGSEDFSACMGTAPSAALLHGPAQLLIRAARATDRLALAVPGSIAWVSDEAAWQQALAAARALGGQGCLCIHPKQVAAVHAAMVPTPQELAWARRVLEQAGQQPDAVFLMDGQMVDAPVLQRARYWLGLYARRTHPV